MVASVNSCIVVLLLLAVFSLYTLVDKELKLCYCLVIPDIDECTTENGGCNQTCTNQVGSFTCSCGTGFELNVDGLDCDGQLSYVIMNFLEFRLELRKLCYHEFY